MSRPAVSVVMPFAGDAAAASQALAALRSLSRQPGDELILADNAGDAPASLDVNVVRASAERSPAHARNTGAEHASGDWILFLDADCQPPPGLIDAYFAPPIADDIGALAGEVRAAPGAETLAGRYGARRSFLGQEAHLAHPFRPRAAAANLLVRRAAFEEIGGFYEGVRAAEDTDFSWRLQEAGWRLELRPEAAVEHRYRATIGELRRQWRGYAAGRAWLARRYSGFVPETALRRAVRRATGGALARGRDRRQDERSAGIERRGRGMAGIGRRLRRTQSAPDRAAPPAPGAATRRSRSLSTPPGPAPGRLERGRYLALDALLSAEELAGFALSNRPHRARSDGPVQAFLIAERFPTAGDPLVELARTLGQVRVEAAARPRNTDVHAVRELAIQYREDDGAAARIAALSSLVVRHPLRSLRDVGWRGSEPPLRALAPAVRRIERERRARVLALGGGHSREVAERIAALAGRPLDDAPRRGRRGAGDGTRAR